MTANDKPYKPKFEYLCSKGHGAAAEFPLDCCPACLRGEPCTGVLSKLPVTPRKAVLTA